MHQELLNKAVEQISALHEINSSDLKLLTERYPYCQTAHVLYAKKLYEEESSIFEKQLRKTSSIVYDRNILLHVIERSPIPENVPAGFEMEEVKIISEPEIQHQNTAELIAEPVVEERNEMQDLISDQPVIIDEKMEDDVLDQIISEKELLSEEEEIQELITSDQPITDEVPVEEIHIQDHFIEETKSESVEDVTTDEDLITQEMLPYSTPDPEVKIELEEIQSDEPIFELPGYNIERELGTLDEKDEIRIDIRRPDAEPEPERTEVFEEEPVQFPVEQQPVTFSGWMQKIAGESKGRVVEMPKTNSVIRTLEVAEKQKEQQLPETFTDEDAEQFAGALAQKSIEPDDKLVTETYARILYMQGKFARAIEVYEVLSLKKPAKSDYFAALIEQIKKKL